MADYLRFICYKFVEKKIYAEKFLFMRISYYRKKITNVTNLT